MNQNLSRTQKQRKKILYLVTQSELGGAQRYVFDLAINLKENFDIAIAFGQQGERGELAKHLKQADIKYYIIHHLKRPISPLNDFLALLEIIKLIKKIKPDIIHLNSSKISILGSIAGLLIKSKIIYTVHGWVFNEPLPSWKILFYKYAEKFTAILKDKIICVSEFDRLIAIKEKIAPEKKLAAIHNGITPINFLSKEQAREKLSQISNIQYPISNIFIGSIGNLYKTKGLEYLIQAGRLLIDAGINLKIIIIGEGEEKKYLENLINQLNLKGHVILAGRIDNAASLLKAFDVYVCSSVKEGLSYTIIEAMQAGLPIVATQVGGNPELIEDPSTNSEQATGILVDAKNSSILAEKIQRLINNQKLQNELGNNAKQKANCEFALEQMVQKTKEVYLL